MATDETHALTRLWLRQCGNDGVGHISIGCSHQFSKSLCGLPVNALGSDDGLTAACPVCLSAWSRDKPFTGASWMLPRGDFFVLTDASGTLQHSPVFGRIERRAQAITQALHPLSPRALGPLGTMPLSRGRDGHLHGDQWCSDYDPEAVESLPVSLGDDSVVPHYADSPVHCQRRLPQPVEDGFFAALSVCRARNGLLSVMGHTGWGLHETVRHEQGMHGASDEVVCEHGAYEVRSALTSASESISAMPGPGVSLVREHERTSEVWDAVKRVMEGWGATAEARTELGRATLLLAFSSGDFSSPFKARPSFRPLIEYKIRNGSRGAVLNVCHARITVGHGEWLSPLPANKASVMDEVVPLLDGLIGAGQEDTVAEDMADFMVSQDHSLSAVAEQYVHESQAGVLLEANSALIPEHWSQWPQGADERGRVLTWVPSPVAKIAPLDALEAAPAPFLPMTFREAQVVLSDGQGVQTR